MTRKIKAIGEGRYLEYEDSEVPYMDFSIPELEAEILRLQKLLADAKGLEKE